MPMSGRYSILSLLLDGLIQQIQNLLGKCPKPIEVALAKRVKGFHMEIFHARFFWVWMLTYIVSVQQSC